MFQHAAARRRLGLLPTPPETMRQFQHAAARRRLEQKDEQLQAEYLVSTRSRPKAAGGYSPVEQIIMTVFQHAAARRRLVFLMLRRLIFRWFQHAAARRRLGILVN